MSAPERMKQQLDVSLAEYTPGIDRAVRFVTIDQVDMLAEFYLHSRTPKPDPRDEVIATLVDTLDNLIDAITSEDRIGDRALTITGATGNLKWFIEATDDAYAALASAKAVMK